MPVVRPSVRPSDLWTQYLKNHFTIQLQIMMIWYQTIENTDAIDYGPCEKTKMATIERFNMYAIDTPCERNIFRTTQPINFKFGL